LNSELAEFSTKVNQSWSDQASPDRFSTTKHGPADLLGLDRLLAESIDTVYGSDETVRAALMDRGYLMKELLC
jgi:hypothetical protein